jgi:hypothetical protein
MKNITKDLVLKVTLWVGVLLMILASYGVNWNIRPFTLEIIGLIYALGYAYGKFKSRTAMLVICVFFVLDYLLWNFGIIDLTFWSIILLTQIL